MTMNKACDGTFLRRVRTDGLMGGGGTPMRKPLLRHALKGVAAWTVGVAMPTMAASEGVLWVYDATDRVPEVSMSAEAVSEGGIETFGVDRVESNGLAPFRTTPRAAVFIIR